MSVFFFLCTFFAFAGIVLCGGPAIVSSILNACGSFVPLTWGAIITYVVLLALWVIIVLVSRLFEHRDTSILAKVIPIEKASEFAHKSGPVIKIIEIVLFVATAIVVILTFLNEPIAGCAEAFDVFRTANATILHQLKHLGFVSIGLSIAYLHIVIWLATRKPKRKKNTAEG